MATALGRGLGVCYQVYHLFRGNSVLQIRYRHFAPNWHQIRSLVQIAAPAVLQFVIASCSWIFLTKLVAVTGGDQGSAGYQTALRLLMFFLLPAWGLSNAASTLVGQNLGARQFERAEQAVLKTAKYNALYMAFVTVLSLAGGTFFVSFFTNDAQVQAVAERAIYIMSLGYIFYGIGMVLMNTFNGAGDTWTPTWIYLVGFWLFQVPLAYLLAQYWDLGPEGVFIAVPVAETAITITSFIFFRRGKWKRVQV
jgi:Na+-driven multidrug efflux pump